MQAARPTGKPPYANTFIGFMEVYREGARSTIPGASQGFAGGIKSLWRGVGPTVFRAAVLTSSQIGTYDQVKNLLKDGKMLPGGARLNEGIGLHFTASMIAGLACSVASQPIDVIKTRVMQDKDRKYAGSAAVVKKLLLNEGPLAFYKVCICAPQTWSTNTEHADVVSSLISRRDSRCAGLAWACTVWSHLCCLSSLGHCSGSNRYKYIALRRLLHFLVRVWCMEGGRL